METINMPQNSSFMKIMSPVTHTENVKLIENLDIEDIKKAYENIGVKNIGRFFSNISHVSIFECLDTHYRFYYPFSICGDEEFYAYLFKQRNYYAAWRWEHRIAFDQIKPDKAVLEIGCGTGNFLKKIKDEKNVDCFGLEFNQLAIKEANKRGLKVYNQTIQEFSQYNKRKFDIVCFFQVLEHVWDVKSFLENAIECLKINGLLILGVPNNNPYLFQNDKFHALNLPPHHAGLWNRNSLEKLGKYFNIKLQGLSIEPLFEVDYFWKVKMAHWKENNSLSYYLGKMMPKPLCRIRNLITRLISNGRNLLAIYSKYDRAEASDKQFA